MLPKCYPLITAVRTLTWLQEQKKKSMEELAQVLAELGIEGEEAAAAQQGMHSSTWPCPGSWLADLPDGGSIWLLPAMPASAV